VEEFNPVVGGIFFLFLVDYWKEEHLMRLIYVGAFLFFMLAFSVANDLKKLLNNTPALSFRMILLPWLCD
jgi:hypothetical protein